MQRCRHIGHQSAPPPPSCHYSIPRRKASTSMYSLTFCVRVMLPERHQWKPAVKTAAVRTPPSTASHQQASQAHFPYTARNFENATRHPPVTGQQRAQTPPRRPFALCRHVAGWTQACNQGSRYVAIATQPVPRLQIRPIVHN